MSYTYLQGQEEEFSEDYSWDIDPCALLNLTGTQETSLLPDKKTTACHDSQYGMMSVHSMEHPGKGKSTLSVEDSHARILALLEMEKALKVREVVYGVKWHELLMKYDRNTSLLKTHHCLFSEVLDVSCVILPKWGLMQDGVFWEQMTLEGIIQGKDAGFWPTPLKREVPGGKPKKLTDAVAIAEGFKPRYYRVVGLEEREVFTGKVSPEWAEWLMGWPMGWTDASQELEMDKFQSWRQQHLQY